MKIFEIILDNGMTYDHDEVRYYYETLEKAQDMFEHPLNIGVDPDRFECICYGCYDALITLNCLELDTQKRETISNRWLEGDEAVQSWCRKRINARIEEDARLLAERERAKKERKALDEPMVEMPPIENSTICDIEALRALRDRLEKG